MRILIVDDSNEKIANLVSFIRELSNFLDVDTAACVMDAKVKLHNEKYDLLISDLLLPIRLSDEPLLTGGISFIEEINRSQTLISPNYILGCTQYGEYLNKFSSIWKVLHYEPSSTVWKAELKALISHITKAKKILTAESTVKSPTLFVEGKTDAVFISEAIHLYFPELTDKILIKSESSAGADWVARQIIIWAKSLQKDTLDNYIKAIGLLDGDLAGQNANNEINRIISSDSAESKTFRVIKLSPTYARDLIKIKQRGLNPPVCIEDVFDLEYRKYAYKMNWLEPRTDSDKLITEPKKWNKYEHSLNEHLQNLGLTDDEKLYLYKFKNDCKELFKNYLINMPDDKKTQAFTNFKKLIEDLITEFKL
jgi:CheY-like chemotaxis protein